jgi:hypothetical protein
MDIDHIAAQGYYEEYYKEEYQEDYAEEDYGEDEEEQYEEEIEEGEYTVSNVKLNAIMTPQQKFRSTNGLCLTCRNKGHFSRQCPQRRPQQKQFARQPKPRFCPKNPPPKPPTCNINEVNMAKKLPRTSSDKSQPSPIRTPSRIVSTRAQSASSHY